MMITSRKTSIWVFCVAASIMALLHRLDIYNQSKFFDESAVPEAVSASTSTKAPELHRETIKKHITTAHPISSPPPAAFQNDSKALSYDRILEADDYRVLFESLLANPTEKSGIYALHLLRTCISQRMFGMAWLPPSGSSHQDEMRQRWIARCSTFTQDELSDERLASLMQDPRITHSFDRIGNPDDLLQQPFGSETHNSIRDRVLATQDPVLLETYGPPLFVDLRAPAVVIDGREYPQQEAVVAMITAWNSAICVATGTRCGERDHFVMQRCARQGLCADDRQSTLRDATREFIGESGARLHDEMMAQFVTLIRNRGRASQNKP